MDLIDRVGLTPDVTFNVLAKRKRITQPGKRTLYVNEWVIPMRQSLSRHSYVSLALSLQTCFIRTQLHRLLSNFYHPSAAKLYNLLRRSRPQETTPSTRAILEDLADHCVLCRKISRGARIFRISLGAEDVIFNERVLMDIMYRGNTRVLHVVVDQTKFSAAAFRRNVETDSLWATLIKFWYPSTQDFQMESW